MKRQNRTTWVSTSSFGGTLDTLALFSSQGKLGKVIKIPSTPDFCIALLGDRPEILSGRPLSNYNKAMSHEEAEPHNMGFYLFIQGDFGHPCPIFLSGKIGQGVSKSPLYPDFCIALLGIARDSLGTSLSSYNKAMSHESRTAQHGFLPLHSGDFGHPCPIFLSGKIGQGYPKSLYTPISA